MSQHRFDQGSERQRRSRCGIASPITERIHNPQRRRWFDVAVYVSRRGRSRERGFKFISSRTLRARARVRIGRFQIGGSASPKNGTAVQGFVYRAESGAGKNRARLARRDVVRSSIAAL